MKKVLFCALLASVALNVFGQLKPVKWSFASQQNGDTEILVVITAEIDKGWNIYSQHLESEFGPVPTSFSFAESAEYKLIGKTEETGNRKEGYDPLFEMNVVKFDGTVRFTQKLQILGPVKEVSGYLTFMTCDENKCLPPKDVDFTIPVL